MIDERKEETASLYAFGLLEGEEKRAFEGELARDANLRRLVDELRQASTGLALSGPQPTPSAKLRDRVMASIEQTERPPATAVSSTPAPAAPNSPASKVVPFPVSVWLGWGMAACFAILSGYLSFQYMNVRTDATVQRQNAELAKLDAQNFQQQLEAERIVTGKEIADLRKRDDLAQLKIAKLASLVEKSQTAAIAVWNPQSKEGILAVENLPAIQSDQDYQLWVIDPQIKDPVSGGVIHMDATGRAHVIFRPAEPVTAAAQFAISRERKGGVQKVQGPVVAAGAL